MQKEKIEAGEVGSGIPPLDDAALTSVFSHLDAKTLLSVSLSCRQFHAIVMNDVVWR